VRNVEHEAKDCYLAKRFFANELDKYLKKTIINPITKQRQKKEIGKSPRH
jgi:hypothetical protein